MGCLRKLKSSDTASHRNRLDRLAVTANTLSVVRGKDYSMISSEDEELLLTPDDKKRKAKKIISVMDFIYLPYPIRHSKLYLRYHIPPMSRA